MHSVVNNKHAIQKHILRFRILHNQRELIALSTCLGISRAKKSYSLRKTFTVEDLAEAGELELDEDGLEGETNDEVEEEETEEEQQHGQEILRLILTNYD